MADSCNLSLKIFQKKITRGQTMDNPWKGLTGPWKDLIRPWKGLTGPWTAPPKKIAQNKLHKKNETNFQQVWDTLSYHV